MSHTTVQLGQLNQIKLDHYQGDYMIGLYNALIDQLNQVILCLVGILLKG